MDNPDLLSRLTVHRHGTGLLGLTSARPALLLRLASTNGCCITRLARLRLLRGNGVSDWMSGCPCCWVRLSIMDDLLLLRMLRLLWLTDQNWLLLGVWLLLLHDLVVRGLCVTRLLRGLL